LKAIVIVICKILTKIGKLIGKGSSLPGKIALKICPDILSRIDFCEYVIAVTGSNGKTSTVELIAHTLTECGFSVAYNKEGSNQIEGVTTLVLNNCDLKGRLRVQVLIVESDERFARYTFSHFSPTHYVFTNLYRDQLSRNGHPEFVFDALKDSIKDKNTTLILNADDPLVSLFANEENKTVYFGMAKNELSKTKNDSVYNDGAHCPRCKEKMDYEFYHYSHIGSYECKKCGYKRQKPMFEVTELDLSKGEFVINGEYRISLFLKSIYNVYNSLAAFTVAALVGADKEAAAKAISGHILKNGRLVCFKSQGRNGVLLTSKHENSISYNQSISLSLSTKEPCTVVIIVDAISRKYFTGEISWLWDIDFEKLNSQNISKIILAGKYCYDLANRFYYTDIEQKKIELCHDTDNLPSLFALDSTDIIAITCFSDRDKLLSNVEIVSAQDFTLPF